MTTADGTGRLDWYGVRCVFKHGDVHYEERITLWHARDPAQAIELAETEAAQYSDAVTDDLLSTRYVGFAQSYRLADEPTAVGAEVFSLVRDSRLPPDEYLSRFFDTGDERQGSIAAP